MESKDELKKRVIDLCKALDYEYKSEEYKKNIYEIRDYTIFLIYYNYLVPSDDLSNTIKKYINNFNKIIDYVKYDGSLWYGVSGYSYLLKFTNAKYYNEEINYSIDIAINYASLLMHKCSVETIGHRIYDMFYGLIGVGNFLLEFNNHSAIKTINEIVDFIKDMLSNELCSFILKPNVFYSSNSKHIFPNGYIDLGFSHGLAGILNFLKRIRKQGFTNTDDLISRLEIFLMQCSNNEKGIIYWNGRYTVGKSQHCSNINTSWCYGFSGILYSLSDKINDFDIEYNINYIFEKIRNASYDEYYFCHGAVGDLYMVYKILEKKKISYSKTDRNSILRKVLAEVEAFINNEDEKLYETTKYSLINGVFSIIIPLIIMIIGKDDLKIFDFFLLLE